MYRTPEHEILPEVQPYGIGRPAGRAGYLAVLCVYDDPLFLDRLCRHLERGGDMFVEFSIAAEDALHLMVYVRFDVIVTDCMSWQGEDHGFLKAMRKRGKEIPLIYFFRCQDPKDHIAPIDDEKASYLAWDGNEIFPPFDELARSIHRAVAAHTPDLE